MFKVHITPKNKITPVKIFQNISCLRFMDYYFNELSKTCKFQNISCLRFILSIKPWGSIRLISKHFMFKVHTSLSTENFKLSSISKHFMFKVHQ